MVDSPSLGGIGSKCTPCRHFSFKSMNFFFFKHLLTFNLNDSRMDNSVNFEQGSKEEMT